MKIKLNHMLLNNGVDHRGKRGGGETWNNVETEGNQNPKLRISE